MAQAAHSSALLVLCVLSALCRASGQDAPDTAARCLGALSSPDAATRATAAEALVAMGPKALFAVCPFTQEHLADRDEHAWRAAVWVEEQIALRYQDDPQLDGYYKTLKPVKLPTMTAKLPGGLTMEFVKIPAGTFVQGSGNPGTGVLLAADMPCNYAPVRKVTLTKPYWLARDEVSQEQWEAVMGFNRSREKWPHRAVEAVSWHEALEFCRRLSKLNPPHVFTLPTEAQWERACRAGGTGRHAFGNEMLLRGDSRLDEGGPWHENHFGLRHLHDGVFEWCLDWFGVYTEEAATDPVGRGGTGVPPVDTGKMPVPPGNALANVGRYRAIRSNYRCCSAAECRAAHRFGFEPDIRRHGVGFRAAAEAK